MKARGSVERLSRLPYKDIIAAGALVASAVAHLDAQVAADERPPIIDMHLHAGPVRSQSHVDSLHARLLNRGVRLAVLSVDDTTAANWSDAAPTDERLDPYWALAEELDIPVGTHTGRRPQSDLPDGCCPNYDDDFGDPSLLAPILERYPELTLWLMHAPGAVEWMDATIALMQSYPGVYAEMSVVNSLASEPAHAETVRTLIDAGLGDRIMFGSDNQPIELIVDRIDRIPFLTSKQKSRIYCENAARFLGLGRAFCR